MWTKALYDLGHIGFDEPFRKLLNQGMIQGSSRFVYRVVTSSPHTGSEHNFPIFLSNVYYQEYLKHGFLSRETLEDLLNNRYIGEWKKPLEDPNLGINKLVPIHVDVNMVDGFELDIEAFRKWRNGEYANAIIIDESGKVLQPNTPLPLGEGMGVRYICGAEVEKMSKSKFNTVNPDILVEKYGADTFRMYEMFLGPVEQSKPWDTKGIEGVHRFLKKLWRLFFDEIKGKVWNTDTATPEELKVLHKCIKKIEEDTERYSFNTAVSTFMICVNELADLKCNKKEVLEQLLIMLTPYAPHISEELWEALGNKGSILDAQFPVFNAAYVTESSKEYPVSINGRVRTNINISLDADEATVQSIVLASELVQKWLEGKAVKKFIFVKGRMINVVI
jgi:leucyl-tRNA synthetase